MMAEAFDTRKLVEALDDAAQPSTSTPQEPLPPIDVLSNDVLVSIFAALEDSEWVRRTIPLVCKEWNELYRSKDASPLHETLEVHFKKEVKNAWQEWLRLVARPVAGGATQQLAPYLPVVHASRVISWAERRASSVRKLPLEEGSRGAFDPFSERRVGAHLKDFSSEDLGRLVASVGPSLTDIKISTQLNELCKRSFWASLRTSVVPAGRLRSFRVQGIGSVINESDVEPLGKLAGSLEELVMWPRFTGLSGGLPRFPKSFCALKKLRRLDLSHHPRIKAIPGAISSLKKLEDLVLTFCDLPSLPKELGALSGLTKLDLTGNWFLGSTPEHRAFPAELRKMTSLRELGLCCCGLSAVPAFVGGLESLEVLHLSGNDELQIDAPLDFLIKGCPLLGTIRLEKGPDRAPWTPECLAHLEAFKAKMRAKNPGATVVYRCGEED